MLLATYDTHMSRTSFLLLRKAGRTLKKSFIACWRNAVAGIGKPRRNTSLKNLVDMWVGKTEPCLNYGRVSMGKAIW
jgi:hypothetical protein